MATNIEQIFRDFAINKIRQIEDEVQHTGVTSEGHPNGGTSHSMDKAGPEGKLANKLESQGDNCSHPRTSEAMADPRSALLEIDRAFEKANVKVLVSKEGGETPRKKNKKHKRHKSKKKKKKRKEEKESSSESGLESDGDERNQPSVKTEATANRGGGDHGQTEDVEGGPKHLHTDPAEGESERKTKKQKRHSSKKKKKRKRKEGEKLGKKSPTRSWSGSTSGSGTESENESMQASKLLPTSTPVVASDKLTHTQTTLPSTEALTVKCESTSVDDCRDALKCNTREVLCSVSVDEVVASVDRKDSLTLACVVAEQNGKQVKAHGLHSLDHKQDLDILTGKMMKQDGEGEKKCGSNSESNRDLECDPDINRVTTIHTPGKKSHSRSCSPKPLSGNSDSPKVHPTSRKRSRSASKKKNSPRRKRSTSRSRRYKSRSLSTKRRQRSISRSCTRNKRSKSRSVRRYHRTRSRSVVRRRRSRSKSHSRRKHSRSRSVRRTRRSRSYSHSRHRRSRSRSMRQSRRTRSRSIVILRRSRKNKRSVSVRRNRSRTRSPKRRRSDSRSPRQSRHSKSRSPVKRRRSKSKSQRRNKSKSRSVQRSKRSKSRSHTRCQSKSKSPKRGCKLYTSPKRRKHSKSSSPTRNGSKSRSVSRGRSSSLTKVEDSKSGSPDKSQHTSLTSTEEQVEIIASKRTDEAEGISEELSSETEKLKEQPPLGLTIQESGQSSAVKHSETDIAPVGPWKPVPLLVDSKVRNKSSPVKVAVNVFASETQASVSEQSSESQSQQRGEVEKCFTTEMPLIHQDFSEPAASCAASADGWSKLTSEQHYTESQSMSDGGGLDVRMSVDCRSRSVSPLSDRPSQCLPPLPDRSAVKELDHITFVDQKPEADVKSAHVSRSSHSRSPAKHDGDCLRSQSPSTEAKSLDGKHAKNTVESSSLISSKQKQSSVSPTRKKCVRSRSPSGRNNSRSPIGKKRSRSVSSTRRKRSKTPAGRKKSKSKSPTKKRKSRSPSRSRKKRSKSRSPARRRRSRSKSAAKKHKSSSRTKRSYSRSPKRKRSKSKSPVRRKRSKSRSPAKRKRSKSRSPGKKKQSMSRSPVRRRRSKSTDKSKRSKSRSPTRRRRSRSRARRSRSRRSCSSSRRRRSGFLLDRRDRWKRTPSHSPVLILRKRRSASRTRRSSSKTPPRLTELDKDQLLEIAKANAAAMCAKAGVPIPESLRPKAIMQLPLPNPVPTPLSLPLPLPMNLPMGMPNMNMNAAVVSMNAALSTMSALTAMPALPTITNKPPPTAVPNTANIEEVKRKVAQKANSISIKELTEKCKKIAESKEEMAIAKPHVSDDEDDEKPFAGIGLRENKGITFSLSNSSAKPATRTEAAYAKEFPVSSGSQHRKKEGEGAYGEWVPVDKKTEKAAGNTSAATDEEGKDSDSVFPDAPLQPVDITLAVSERAVAQKRLAENPFDVNAICMLSRAQEQVDAWAQSNTIPGLFTGSTGAQVLSSEELSTSGPQAWIKKDQFLRAAPVSGGVGEFLMRKMGWRAGEGLGKYREGTVEPIMIDFKTDRKGLVAEGEKTQKSGSLVVMKDLLGKHPVSALMEMCNKKKWAPPEFVMVHDSGPDHRKNFLFKVVINGNDYQPQTASPNKKHAKAMAAAVALQAMGEVSGDSVHSGPVFTAASTTG